MRRGLSHLLGHPRRITTGYVRTLTWSADGESVPLGFWQTGEIFGYPITQTSPYEAQCLSEVKADYLGQHYQPSQGELISQTIQSNQLLSISHCRQGALRLLKFLCWLAERFGQVGEKGHHVKIRLTHHTSTQYSIKSRNNLSSRFWGYLLIARFKSLTL